MYHSNRNKSAISGIVIVNLPKSTTNMLFLEWNWKPVTDIHPHDVYTSACTPLTPQKNSISKNDLWESFSYGILYGNGKHSPM